MSDRRSEMELFLAALETPEGSREAIIDGIADPSARERVRRLLEAHCELDSRSDFAEAPHRRSYSAEESLIGAVVDDFRIVGVIGRGGMGIVFEAEQLHARRRVALKTVSSALASPEELTRLEREGRLLARISHAGVAHVYGVGHAVAFGGLPYLVMELIDGMPITRFVASHGSSVAQRVQLLAEIAETVSHVHTRGLIHRDLKPANVLVDRQGHTKILDFGVARFRSAQEARESVKTQAGQLLGTLAYMSPEQVAGDPDAIDGRADVYSLGVLAYELFAGRTPLDLTKDSLPTALRRITDEEPVPVASVSSVDRDLATVITKSLRKNPADRYSSAAELAADLRRVLRHEPICARDPSRLYRSRKFVRRHRIGLASIVAIVVSLAGGMVWALAERREAIDARSVEREAKSAADEARNLAIQSEARASASAERERLRSEATSRLNDLLSRIVAQATPQAHAGRAVTAEEMVDDLARDLEAGRVEDAYIRGRTHLVLCDARKKAGRIADAYHHLRQARVDLGLSTLCDLPDRADLAVAAAVCANDTVAIESSVAELRGLLDAVAVWADAGASERRVCSALANTLARCQRDPSEAEECALRACAISRVSHGESSITHAGDLHTLGFVYSQFDRWVEAIAIYRQVVDLRRSAQNGSLSLATALQNLGHALRSEHRIHDAIEVCEEALAIKRRILGNQPHPDLAYGLDALAIALRDSGRGAEALPLFSEAADHFRRVFGDQHEDLAICLTEWATALRFVGESKAARQQASEAVRIHESWSSQPSAAFAAALEQLGLSAIEGGEAKSALEPAARAVAMREAVHGPNDFRVADALVVQSTALLILGRYVEALAAGKRAMDLRRARHGPDHPQTWSDAALVYAPMAKSGQIEPARRLAEEAHSVMVRTLGASHAQATVARIGLANLYRLEGREDEARALEGPGPPDR